jgi:hypothetical protein
MKNTTYHNSTTYNTFKIEVKGRGYVITNAFGQHNYWLIKQINHVRGLGNYYDTFDEMLNHYKSVSMKAALIQLQGL